jgi:hypothetical protein
MATFDERVASAQTLDDALRDEANQVAWNEIEFTRQDQAIAETQNKPVVKLLHMGRAVHDAHVLFHHHETGGCPDRAFYEIDVFTACPARHPVQDTTNAESDTAKIKFEKVQKLWSDEGSVGKLFNRQHDVIQRR